MAESATPRTKRNGWCDTTESRPCMLMQREGSPPLAAQWGYCSPRANTIYNGGTSAPHFRASGPTRASEERRFGRQGCPARAAAGPPASLPAPARRTLTNAIGVVVPSISSRITLTSAGIVKPTMSTTGQRPNGRLAAASARARTKTRSSQGSAQAKGMQQPRASDAPGRIPDAGRQARNPP